jgi:hypothetical protein
VVRCEVVYGTYGVESYIVVRCEVVNGTDGVESRRTSPPYTIRHHLVHTSDPFTTSHLTNHTQFNTTCPNTTVVRCEVVNGTDGVESRMVVRC